MNETVESQNIESGAPIDPNVLPRDEHLKEIYHLGLQSVDLPDTFRRADEYAEANVTYAFPNPNVAEVQEEYIAQATEHAYNASWWVQLTEQLEYAGADPEQAKNVHIIAKHSLNVLADGEPTDQDFEVFEVGDIAQDPQTVEVIMDTLEMIDQLTGGYMAASPNRPVIAIGSSIPLAKNRGDVEIKGISASHVVYINTPAVQAIADETGANFHELLSVVTVHEYLGHSLERMVEGRAGDYYYAHFEYSDNMVPGEVFDRVHETITPKDTSVAGSQPVREYGKTGASEDVATSVDATIAAAMDWTESTDKTTNFKSQIDEYRRDLAMQLMEQAAELALAYDNTPGVVGSDLRYIRNDEGLITGVVPLRKMEIVTVPGEEAVHEEIDKMTRRYTPSELVITQGDLM